MNSFLSRILDVSKDKDEIMRQLTHPYSYENPLTS